MKEGNKHGQNPSTCIIIEMHDRCKATCISPHACGMMMTDAPRGGASANGEDRCRPSNGTQHARAHQLHRRVRAAPDEAHRAVLVAQVFGEIRVEGDAVERRVTAHVA